MPADIDTAVDVAVWFCDQALNHNEYLQPQKLHRLMFLAQGYYAVAYGGRKLMPAVFVADQMGPIEPNVYKVFTKGRPEVDVDMFLPDEAEALLISIWRRFGHYSAEQLTRLTKDTEAYRKAFAKGPRAEIPLVAMRLSFTRAQETPTVDRVVQPKMLRSQSGGPVKVKSWVPGAKPAGR